MKDGIGELRRGLLRNVNDRETFPGSSDRMRSYAFTQTAFCTILDSSDKVRERLGILVVLPHFEVKTESLLNI